MNTLSKPQNLVVVAVGIIIVLTVVVLSHISMHKDEAVSPDLFTPQLHTEPVNPVTKVQAPWDIRYLNTLSN